MAFVVALLLGSASSAPAGDWEIRADLERRSESWNCRFSNPSSFDDAGVVPHFFEQSYDADQSWARLALERRLARVGSQTRVGLSTEAPARGDDFDTFLQPSGDVVVSSDTTSPARMIDTSIARRPESA